MIKTIDLDINYDLLLKDYHRLKVDNLLDKKNQFKQIAVQCRKDATPENQLYESCGSLTFDWTKYDETGELPLRKDNLEEDMFTEVCDYFKDSYIEETINKIKSEYNVLRGRFLKSLHKTCLTYHNDPSPRLHVPIYTNDHCMMIIDDKVVRLPFGNTYVVDTTLPHTALNASKKSRVHMVFCIDKF